MNLKTDTSVPKTVWAAVWICVLLISVAHSENISDTELRNAINSAYEEGFKKGRDEAMKLAQTCQQELAVARGAPIDDDSNNPSYDRRRSGPGDINAR